MSNATIEQQIRKAIEAFVEELSALVQQAAIQSVNDAFGGAAAGGSPRRGATGRAARDGRKKGVKRDPADLATLQAELLSAIKATPGQRMEQIASALKSTTPELALPARKLIATGKVKTKGERRATRYFPG